MIEENVLEQICLQNRAQQSLSLSATAGSIQQNKHTNTQEPREQLFLLTKECGSPGQCATTQSCGSGLHWEYATNSSLKYIHTAIHLFMVQWFPHSFLFGISLKVMSAALASSPSLTPFYLTRIVPLSSSRNKKTYTFYLFYLYCTAIQPGLRVQTLETAFTEPSHVPPSLAGTCQCLPPPSSLPFLLPTITSDLCHFVPGQL